MSIRLHYSKLESLFVESMAPQLSDEEKNFFSADDDDDFPERPEKPDVNSITATTHFAPNVSMSTKRIRLPKPYHSLEGSLRIIDDYLHGSFSINPHMDAQIRADKERKKAFAKEFHQQLVAVTSGLADEVYDDVLIFNKLGSPTYVLDFNPTTLVTEFHFGEVGAEPLAFSRFPDFKDALDSTALKLEKVLNVGREILIPTYDKAPIIRSIFYAFDY